MIASSRLMQVPFFAVRHVIRARNSRNNLENPSSNAAFAKITAGNEIMFTRITLLRIALVVIDSDCIEAKLFKSGLNPKVSITS